MNEYLEQKAGNATFGMIKGLTALTLLGEGFAIGYSRANGSPISDSDLELAVGSGMLLTGMSVIHESARSFVSAEDQNKNGYEIGVKTGLGLVKGAAIGAFATVALVAIGYGIGYGIGKI